MAIARVFDETKKTVTLSYKGKSITPELDMDDSKRLLEVLSDVIDKAYQRLRDAGLE